MQTKKETKKISGIDFEVETITTTPEDGFVAEEIIKPVKSDRTRNRYHKGYTITKTYSTNDPRITRPFIYGICGIFFIIGLAMLLFNLWFFGLIFIGVSVFTFVKSKKDIDAIAKELKNQGKDVTIDSKEEAIQIGKEFSNELKNSFNEVSSKTFTKDSFKWILKISLPIYILISLIIVGVFSILINIIIGFIILIILVLGGLFYYWLLSKICRH